eukprot:503721-Prorocentrum_lima.AAC.1
MPSTPSSSRRVQAEQNAQLRRVVSRLQSRILELERARATSRLHEVQEERDSLELELSDQALRYL